MKYQGFEIEDFEEGQIRFRIREGKNGSNDKTIEIATPGGQFVKPKLSLLFILADFKSQVEENNYPRYKNQAGLTMLEQRISSAMRFGWRDATEKTAEEVKNKK